MDREGAESSLALVIVAVLAIIVALFLGGMMVMFGPMMGGGGMMGGGTGWGWGGIAILVLAVVVAVVALAFAFRPSRTQPPAMFPPPWGYPAPPPQAAPPAASVVQPSGVPTEESARIERLQEAVVVKALDEDERRLYLQIREAGGAALQRDLVASGAFSKAKVTRLLDKLERRGLVVRERYGATNRVKLTWKGPPAA